MATPITWQNIGIPSLNTGNNQASKTMSTGMGGAVDNLQKLFTENRRLSGVRADDRVDRNSANISASMQDLGDLARFNQNKDTFSDANLLRQYGDEVDIEAVAKLREAARGGFRTQAVDAASLQGNQIADDTYSAAQAADAFRNDLLKRGMAGSVADAKTAEYADMIKRLKQPGWDEKTTANTENILNEYGSDLLDRGNIQSINETGRDTYGKLYDPGAIQAESARKIQEARNDKTYYETTTDVQRKRIEANVAETKRRQDLALQPTLDRISAIDAQLQDMQYVTDDKVVQANNSDGGIVGYLHSKMGHTSNQVEQVYQNLLGKGYNQDDIGRIMLTTYNIRPGTHHADSLGRGIDLGKWNSDMKYVIKQFPVMQELAAERNKTQTSLQEQQNKYSVDLLRANASNIDRAVRENKGENVDWTKVGGPGAATGDKSSGALLDKYLGGQSPAGGSGGNTLPEPEQLPTPVPTPNPRNIPSPKTTVNGVEMQESRANQVAGDAIIDSAKMMGSAGKWAYDTVIGEPLDVTINGISNSRPVKDYQDQKVMTAVHSAGSIAEAMKMLDAEKDPIKKAAIRLYIKKFYGQ